jgi:tetratricopeptide (TPR) repeat protein
MPTKPKGTARDAAPKFKPQPKSRSKSKLESGTEFESQTEPESESQPEAKINLQGSDNAVAVGPKSFAANVKFIFQGNWKPFAAVLFVVGVLLVAILWFVVPRTAEFMSGQFNVAVAEFLVQDADGKSIRSEDGSLLATYIEGQIVSQFTEIELNKTIPYDVWGPKETGSIEGDTPEARSRAAAELAEKIHAHVLIYGVIISEGARSRFMPEFYVNHASFQDASEITGEHEIGSQVRLALPFIDSIQAVENPALAGRVNAMDLITLGLAYYSVDDYENAARYLEQAAAEQRWLETSGKEVAYLLIGNTYIRWASKDDDAQYLPAAAKNYDEALRINPDYGRGLVGQANVLYMEAVLDNPQIDPVKLDQADKLLLQALALEGQPESANIPAKSHFQRGQIDLARYKAQVPVISGEADWIAKAKDEFTFVVTEYEAGDTSLKSLASHTYFRLGQCAYYRDLMDPQAIVLIEKAISISSLFYQAEYTAGLGNLYNARGEKENAIRAFEDAIAIAESNGDAKSALKYQQALDKLMQP